MSVVIPSVSKTVIGILPGDMITGTLLQSGILIVSMEVWVPSDIWSFWAATVLHDVM